MGNKLIRSLITPYLWVSLSALVLFAGGLLWFNPFAGLAAFLITAMLGIYFYFLIRRKADIWQKYANTVTEEMDRTFQRFVVHNPLPLCIVDGEGTLLWFNQPFPKIYEEAEMLNSHITELTGLKYSELLQCGAGEKYITVNRDGKIYRVMATFSEEDKKGSILLYWVDVTNLENLKSMYNDEKLCYAFVEVDNYDELLSGTPDEKKSILASQIESALRQWVTRISATLVRYKSGRYFIAFEHKYLDKLEAGKFSILDEVRAIETEADFPASLSIGIGVDGKSLIELEEFASAALDLALGRGGDQAVVKTKSKVDYYGGKLQTVEKRNKGKSRIMAHALRQMIDQSSKVLIMGHRNPDMDSMGAALGISRVVKNRNKEGAIIVGSLSPSIRRLYLRAQEPGQHKFLSVDEAKSIADKDTLIIIVDTHRPALIESAELLSMTDKVVIIDHHRKSEDCIENATLTYMEAYASSTSELVTEILQYIGDGKKTLEKYEAEALLGGITVDTKSFSIKTGVRTFEAAAWLRRNGADTANVRQFFQTDMDSFKLRSALIADAEIYPGGIAISACEGEYPDINIIISQAADELLNIQDIRASFVVGQDENGKTVVSARSLGEVNVQTLMEKMGGGGHLTTAGTQVELSIEETVDEIKELIRDLQ
ncbi:MAG: DHH family phosphoesterase [Eubacteriales bacterium]|nr:DHH family phosphoesterase [Eubacteriales bacterium]